MRANQKLLNTKFSSVNQAMLILLFGAVAGIYTQTGSSPLVYGMMQGFVLNDLARA